MISINLFIKGENEVNLAFYKKKECLSFITELGEHEHCIWLVAEEEQYFEPLIEYVVDFTEQVDRVREIVKEITKIYIEDSNEIELTIRNFLTYKEAYETALAMRLEREKNNIYYEN